MAGPRCGPRALLALAGLAVLAACTASPWGQDDVDRLREWQERQDERLLAQQRGLEERRRLRDDLLLERQGLRADLQLHRERQQDERQTQRDERLNDGQRQRDDHLQERQAEQSDAQRHRQDLRDRGLDERQRLRDELAADREHEVEDRRRQREQLRDQTRRDGERSEREREHEQQRREREREREQQRRERERDLRDQRRRWRRDVEEADKAEAEAGKANATDVKSYQGSQLWRVKVEGDDVANLQRIEDDGVAQVWLGNATVWDLLVLPEHQTHVAKLLADHGLAYSVAIPDVQRAIAEENPALSEEELELTGRKGHRMTWQHYHRAPDMHDWMDYLAKTYPAICEMLVIGHSVEGRPLKVVHLKSGKPGSPALWVDGGIHAREWITSASVSYVVNELVENRDAHRAWLDGVDLYLLPLANPDGYEYSHTTDRMWRKNRRRGAGGGCDGIDLNRNFGYKWGGKGAGPQPCQEIYRGAAAFSEPETAAIQSFVLARKAALRAYLSFHSYGQYVLYPWGYDRFVPPDHEDLKRVAGKLGGAMRATSGQPYTAGSSAALLYPASGGSDDWAKGVAGLKYAFTVEMRDSGRHGFVLPASYIVGCGKEALAAVKTLAQEVAAL